MSRYVKHPHGMVLGSDNEFFVIDRAPDTEPELVLPDGVEHLRDGYRAIVSLEPYQFTTISTLNVGIRTPTDQLCWNIFTIRHDFNGFPRDFQYRQLRPWVAKWLTDNIGEQYLAWDTYSRASASSRGMIFFKKRSDALRFIRYVGTILHGI